MGFFKRLFNRPEDEEEAPEDPAERDEASSSTPPPEQAASPDPAKAAAQNAASSARAEPSTKSKKASKPERTVKPRKTAKPEKSTKAQRAPTAEAQPSAKTSSAAKPQKSAKAQRARTVEAQPPDSATKARRAPTVEVQPERDAKAQTSPEIVVGPEIVIEAEGASDPPGATSDEVPSRATESPGGSASDSKSGNGGRSRPAVRERLSRRGALIGSRRSDEAQRKSARSALPRAASDSQPNLQAHRSGRGLSGVTLGSSAPDSAAGGGGSPVGERNGGSKAARPSGLPPLMTDPAKSPLRSRGRASEPPNGRPSPARRRSKPPEGLSTPAKMRSKPPAAMPKPGESRPPPQAGQGAAGAQPNMEPPRLPSDPNELGSELDAGFDAISETAGAPPTAGRLTSRGADESFDEIAGLHLRPLRELVMEARWGAAPTSWVEVCLPAVRTVHRFAEELGRAVLLPLLDDLIGHLEGAQNHDGATLAPASASALDASLEALIVHLPLLGEIDAERDRREPVIVRALLLQVPGCDALMIERLAGAGLAQLAPLLAASADELAVATGIDREVAIKITERLARYREQNASMTGSAQVGAELERLEGCVAQLRRVQEAFDEASESWSEKAIASKPRLRDDRAQLLAQIELTLARLGELDRIQKLERMAFKRKLSELDDILRQLQTRAAAGQ